MTHPLDCRLELTSNSIHLAQLFAGLAMLESQGRIRVSVSTHSTFQGGLGGLEVLRVRLGDGPVVLFDTSDYLDRTHSEELAGDVSLIFRRMAGTATLDDPASHPLGPGYPIHEEGNLWWRRGMLLPAWRDRAMLMCREVPFLARLLDVQASAATLTLNKLVIAPEVRRPAAVLFGANLWDPDRAPTPEAAKERHGMNRMRTGLVRALRERLGDRFVGGITPSEYSRRTCPDCLLTEGQAHQAAFLSARERTSIGIATAGLYGSLGFKFAEYLAGGMAIISEPLSTHLPGPIREGENYLTFNDIDGCLAAVETLLADDSARGSMQRRNSRYFQEHVRPDRLVGNALEKAGAELRA